MTQTDSRDAPYASARSWLLEYDSSKTFSKWTAAVAACGARREGVDRENLSDRGAEDNRTEGKGGEVAGQRERRGGRTEGEERGR